MKLYVGNLSFKTTEADLSDLFSQVGPLASVQLITDRDTGRSRGFAFVEYQTKEDGEAAIERFTGSQLDGRTVQVNAARPREARDDNRRGGGNGGGNRFRGGRYDGGGGGGGGRHNRW